MNEERIKEVFSDEEFVKELFSKETPEEAQALFVEKDIDVTIEEIVKLGEFVANKLQQIENGESAELTEDELADVSGGVVAALYIGVMIAINVGFLATVGVIVAKHLTGRW